MIDKNKYEKKVLHYNNEVQKIKELEGVDLNDISDGYHTFGELYKHRIHLYISLCDKISRLKDEYKKSGITINIYKSKLHDDGSEFEGWFIMQVEDSNVGQIRYHLPNEYWDKCNFAEILDKANEWDGHTSDDVLEKLLII